MEIYETADTFKIYQHSTNEISMWLLLIWATKELGRVENTINKEFIRIKNTANKEFARIEDTAIVTYQLQDILNRSGSEPTTFSVTSPFV